MTVHIKLSAHHLALLARRGLPCPRSPGAEPRRRSGWQEAATTDEATLEKSVKKTTNTTSASPPAATWATALTPMSKGVDVSDKNIGGFAGKHHPADLDNTMTVETPSGGERSSRSLR